MAKKALAILLWSGEDRQYIWQKVGDTEKGAELSSQDHLSHLLGEYVSFSFQGQQGHLTLLKEMRVRGGDGYWYAYHRQGKRVVKKYAGRPNDLTIARLEELALTVQANINQREPVQPSRLLHPQPTHSSLLQQIPLLIPKLHPPRPATSLVHRKRLLVQLEEGISCKLTLILAPAGFGKTMLVSDWIALRHEVNASSLPVAWVALDEGDNDLTRFWRYFIAACQTFFPHIGENLLPLLRVFGCSPFPYPAMETFLIELLNELACLPGHGILVLEDYHVIQRSDIHQSISFILEHQPANFHLILMTRSEPPLPLAKLRAHGELVELEASHLCFTQEETRAFLWQTLPYPLEEDLLPLLQRRTEGWITGLRLLTLALRGYGTCTVQEMEQRLATISGSQRPILDYLVTEVLASQEEPLQTFLLQTTGLVRLTDSLCDMVTGRDDSTLLLKQIEQAQLFLLPLDENRTWYHYHALFAEAMQHEARHRLGEANLLAIANKASYWYEQNNLLYEAVEAALSARELTRAAALMTRIMESQPILHHQEWHTFLRWLSQFPEEILRESSTLCSAYAVALLFTTWQRTSALTPQFEKYLHMAELRLQALGDLPCLGEVLTLHAFLSEHVNDHPTVIRCAQSALTMLPDEERCWRSLALALLGKVTVLTGRMAEARQILHHSWRLNPIAYENNYARSDLLVQQSYLAFGVGHLEQADLLLRQILDIASDDRTDRGMALLLLAALSYERNHLSEAELYIQQVYTLHTKTGNELLWLQSTTLLARVRYARGECTQAQDILQHLSPALTQPRWYREIELWLAHFAFSSGDIVTAQHILANLPAITEDEMPLDILHEHEQLLAARLLIAQGKTEKVQQALEILAYWHAEAQSQARLRSEVEVLLIMARAYERLTCKQKAKVVLKEALTLAQTAGYQRLFLDEGAEIAALLKGVVSEVYAPPQVTFLRMLLQGFMTAQSSTPAASSDRSELLSPQERRVFHLLAVGYTNPEIANELVVSLNTVKTQLKSIYRKLGISKRHEASEVAHQLGLR
jgi:LuxR family transcriptional regulator, maltose regulon positive regulatory protein